MGVPYAEVIGDPIAHSKSPAIHNFWLRKLGLEGEYRIRHVRAPELSDYFEARRVDPDFRGCNVAMPLKEPAFALLETNPITRRIGALNTVVRYDGTLVGTNTDWQAINLLLDTVRLDPKRVAIVGTGGGARAALAEMKLMQKAPHVILISRTPGKAEALLDHFGLSGEALPLGAVPEADLLINASPLGMTGYPPLDFDLAGLSERATVLDMVYAPVETPLIRAAQARGLRAIDGLSMLIQQASMAFTHFLKSPPNPVESPELREILTR